MILITAGTTKFPFNRLEKVAVRLAKLYPKKTIIFQSLKITELSFPKNIEIENYISPEVFEGLLRKAETIVTHGGYATVMKSLALSKTKPLVIPRLKRFSEHVNDHQLYFAKFMQKKGLVSIVNNSDNIQDVLDNNFFKATIVKKYLDKVEVRKEMLSDYLLSIL